MKVNLNDTVSVILTKYGADKLNNINSEIQKRFPNYSPDLHYEGETYKTQLWCLFEEFGSMINLGSNELPFKNNEIELLN